MISLDSNPSAKMANSHLREGDVECPEEMNPSALGPRVQVTDVEVEKQSEAAMEMDSAIEGEISSAATQRHHKGAAEKHKFNTLGYQVLYLTAVPADLHQQSHKQKIQRRIPKAVHIFIIPGAGKEQNCEP